MTVLNDIKYEKMNFDTYDNRMKALFHNQKLLDLGLAKRTLAKTEYGYAMDCISIGYGEKELFIVAGTHGSEVIGVDFVTQLLENFDLLKEFDPNVFKIHVIPIQNPEGFDISSSSFSNIGDEDFKNVSYEYYLRYKMDWCIAYATKELNLFIHRFLDSDEVITADRFLFSFKDFVKNNQRFKALADKKVMPNIAIFTNLLNSISSVNSLEELKMQLLAICNMTIDKLDSSNISDCFLKVFLEQLKIAFGTSALWKDMMECNLLKSHQQMFADCQIKNLKCKKLELDTQKIYQLYKHPLGSQIAYDATGVGINLNANHLLNPGMNASKENITIWGLGARSNIKNYVPGPLGTPARDVYHFEYAIENKALFHLLNESYQNGTYLATLLYHGTGGLIYYKPCLEAMDEIQYSKYYDYNKKIASVYHESTNYKILEESGTTGYGDFLRRVFPGVLLIELSKMGGNPIAPYGDDNNIYETLNVNFMAINNLLKNFKMLSNSKIKSK